LRLLVVVIIIAASVAVVMRPQIIDDLGLRDMLGNVNGFVDGVANRADDQTTGDTGGSSRGAEEAIEELDALPETDVAETVFEDTADNVVEELVIDSGSGTVDTVQQQEAVGEATSADNAAGANANNVPAAAPEPEPLPPPVDFSLLPEPAAIIDLAAGEAMPSVPVSALEDGGEVYVDVIRDGDLSVARDVRFAPVAVDGNAFGSSARRYELDNGGALTFEPGQPRARMTLVIPSNDTREADADVMLGLYDPAQADRQLAEIRLTVQDDDQRAFEASLPVNTVGFAAPRVTAREFDPAVQIDIVRYRADTTAIEVPYRLIDVSATEGQDYFAPGISVVYFGPGQRTARILIPLGQDARPEQDERFTVELDGPPAPANSGIYASISVTISDDDL
jgi:hypothetical protein